MLKVCPPWFGREENFDFKNLQNACFIIPRINYFQKNKQEWKHDQSMFNSFRGNTALLINSTRGTKLSLLSFNLRPALTPPEKNPQENCSPKKKSPILNFFYSVFLTSWVAFWFFWGGGGGEREGRRLEQTLFKFIYFAVRGSKLS